MPKMEAAAMNQRAWLGEQIARVSCTSVSSRQLLLPPRPQVACIHQRHWSGGGLKQRKIEKT